VVLLMSYTALVVLIINIHRAAVVVTASCHFRCSECSRVY
jgi:hypothetical protein